jgi:hypothetical protein
VLLDGRITEIGRAHADRIPNRVPG